MKVLHFLRNILICLTCLHFSSLIHLLCFKEFENLFKCQRIFANGWKYRAESQSRAFSRQRSA